MTVILSIDVGTTTICGVAVSTDGDLIASVERPNDSAMTCEVAGWAEQNPLQIRDRVFEVLRELSASMDGVVCVGLTGQMHGMLCVDAALKPLTALITWQDGRCLGPAADGRSYLEYMRQRVPRDLWGACGCMPASGFMGSTLFWMGCNGALPDNTERISFIHDWIAGLLADQLPVTDPGDAGSAGLFDLSRMCWHDEILVALELPAGLLPVIHESGEIIGRVSVEAASATGLAPGTPICNPIGDNQASFVGSIAKIDRSILVNIGTGGQISWAVPSFCRVSGMETRYLPFQRYMLVGASLCGGQAYAWLNEVIRDWLNQFGCQVDPEEIYERLNELAADAPADRQGLMARTTFAGTRDDPGLRGSIEGISLKNFSLDNVARAVLEGMVEELFSFYAGAGGRAGNVHEYVVASGNAVRKNPLLREIISARWGWPVLVPRHHEEAAFGAALLAGVSAGVWPDLDAAGTCVQYHTT